MLVKSEKYKNCTIEIWTDEHPFESPRNWDNLGTMVCWHNCYNLGDEQPNEYAEDYLQNLVEQHTDNSWEWIETREIDECIDFLGKKGYVILPLYLYDHSGITMNTTGLQKR